MNVFVRKSLHPILLLLVWLFLLFHSANSYSVAWMTEGKIKWEIRNGNAYLISHNISVINKGAKTPCPVTCVFAVDVVPQGNKTFETLPPNTTLEQLNAYIRGPKLLGDTGIRATEASKFCLTLITFPPPGLGVQDSPTGCNSNPDVGEPPVGPIEPPVSCSLSNGELNHGVIDSAITDGNVSRTNLSLTCSKSATVRIKANAYQPADGVALNGPGGLRSFVTLNGVAADPGITVKANNSASISVESMLRGAGNIAAGSYSGSITLVTTII